MFLSRGPARNKKRQTLYSSPPPLPAYKKTPKSVSFMSFNIWGLPWPLTTNPSRFRSIVDVLTFHSELADVIGFQEVFCNEAKEALKHLTFVYPYHSYHQMTPMKSDSSLLSSGLLIVSKFPIVDVDFLTYKNCSGFDCFAQKGAQKVTLCLPNHLYVDVFNTHLESGNNEKSKAIRLNQIDQLLSFMNNTRQVLPFSERLILLGDFNAPPFSDEYLAITKNGFFDTECCPVKHPPSFANPEQRIDFIFTSSSFSPYDHSTNRRLSLRRSGVLTDKHSQLSDHFAIVAEFQFPVPSI